MEASQIVVVAAYRGGRSHTSLGFDVVSVVDVHPHHPSARGGVVEHLGALDDAAGPEVSGRLEGEEVIDVCPLNEIRGRVAADCVKRLTL